MNALNPEAGPSIPNRVFRAVLDDGDEAVGDCGRGTVVVMRNTGQVRTPVKTNDNHASQHPGC